jgi:hypothetical protein
MRRQTSFLILLTAIVLVSGLLLIGGCSSTSSIGTQTTATTGTTGTGLASGTAPEIPPNLQRPQGPTVPSQPQGVPGIVITINRGSLAFTTDDARNYIQAHPMAGDQQETITRVEFLPTSKVQQLLHGDTIGTPPNYMLCYAQLQGVFTFTSWDGTLLTFNTGVMVFDAHTGNLLLEGGLPTSTTSGGGSPTPPVATPTVPRVTPTPTAAPKGVPTATATPRPAPTATPRPAPTSTATPYPALQVTIASPADGSTYYTNQTIPCSGTYSGGAGQTIPNSDITWTAYNTVSGTYTAMGTGTSINASLAAGSYEIQFEVFDPVAQESAGASVGISVVQFIP